MRNARDIVKSSFTSQCPRSNALWMISLLMNTTTFQKMDTIFAMIISITCSKQVNKNVSQNDGIMNRKIENFQETLNQKKMATKYGPRSLCEGDEALTREELNTEEKTLQLSPKSPFKKHYDNLYVILKNKVKNENTVNEAVTNSLYSNALVERLLKQLLPTTPFWNGFLLGDLQRNEISNVYKLYGQHKQQILLIWRLIKKIYFL